MVLQKRLTVQCVYFRLYPCVSVSVTLKKPLIFSVCRVCGMVYVHRFVTGQQFVP